MRGGIIICCLEDTIPLSLYPPVEPYIPVGPSVGLEAGEIEMESSLAFEYERATKNKYRFREASDEPVMGTIYISKDHFEDRPDRLEVTLRVLDQ